MGFLQAFRPIALDLLATIVFVVLVWLTGDIVLATVAGVAAGIARFAVIKLKRLPVGPLQYLSVIFVLGGGIATIVTKDPIFMQIKASLVPAAVAVVMLTTNWMAPYLPPIVTENLEPRVIRITSIAWGVLILALAAANAVVAFTFSFAAWSWFAAVVPAVVQVGGFAVHFAVFRMLVWRNIRAKLATQPAA